MPPKVSGRNNQRIRQVEERFETDRYGVDICQLVEMVPAALFPGSIARDGAVHPRFSTMGLSRRGIERVMAGAFYRVTYTFEGYLFEIPSPTYELDGSLNEQPIQTHPDFADFAGTPDEPLNGAIFVDPVSGEISTASNAVFREFSAGTDFAGIEAYLDPGATWTEISFSLAQPSLTGLGTKDSPDGPNPTLAGRDWLLWQVSSRVRGYVTESRKTWKLSGRGGWNDAIY